MAYKVPTLEEMTTFLVALFKAMFPTLHVGSRLSYHWKRLKVTAAASTDIHAHVDTATRDLMPDTARGDSQLRWGKIIGVDKKGATPARKSSALRVRGTVAAPFVDGEELIHVASTLRFALAESGVIPAAGFIDVDVVAIDVGAATRLEAGEDLEFVVTPAGIETQARIVLDLDEDGQDQERESSYGIRILDRFANPPMGGAANDYVAWALAMPTVAIGTAYCYPNRAGLGTVDVVAMHAGTGTGRSLDAGDRAALLAYLLELAPAAVAGTGADVAIRVLETNMVDSGVRIAIEPRDAASEFDWDDQTPMVVAAWTAGTRTMQFTTARPGSMAAGDRLVIRGVASSQTGEELVIEALTSTDSVVLQEAPTVAPAATDIVYSGGPLVTPIRDAIFAHLSGQLVYADADTPISEAEADTDINARVLAEGVGPTNEDGRFGPWTGDILIANLLRIATYHRGVRNGEVEDPATDTVSTDYVWPNDDKIDVINPTTVVIHRRW